MRSFCALTYFAQSFTLVLGKCTDNQLVPRAGKNGRKLNRLQAQAHLYFRPRHIRYHVRSIVFATSALPCGTSGG